MNLRSVRLVKKHERIRPQPLTTVESVASPNRWSTAVRSWIVEFRRRDRSESLPAFDSLFKGALPQSGRAD
jgi:hypothetical protein